MMDDKQEAATIARKAVGIVAGRFWFSVGWRKKAIIDVTASLLPLLATIRREDARECRAACRGARASERCKISNELRRGAATQRSMLERRKVAATTKNRLRPKLLDEIATVIDKLDDSTDDKPTPVADD